MASRTLLKPAKVTNWNTPIELFTALNEKFHFTGDIAADTSNALCHNYFTEKFSFFDNIDRIREGEVLWCNPPYGRQIVKWVEACKHLQSRGIQTVMLLPARTDTQWFQKLLYGKNGIHVHFISGRLKFQNPETGLSDVPAAFPSMLVWFKPNVDAPFVCAPLPR